MPQLKGSCHCGAVRFSVFCRAGVPYMRCYCSICRKTAGGGGFAINLGGDQATLKVEGEEHITVYRARGTASTPSEVSPARRHFCKHCGAALYVFDPRWPDLVHPFASAIDSPLPPAPESVFIMLDAKPGWVKLPPDATAPNRYAGYPDESLADWHKARGLYDESAPDKPEGGKRQA
ncbi:MAG: GFA family protein [Kiloniellaceae bacterium]